MTLFPKKVNHPLCRLSGVWGLIYMTDQDRTGSTAEILPKLPAGTVVIFRDYNIPNRGILAAELKEISHRHQLLFFIAGDIDLARDVGADGIHLPEWLLYKTNKASLKGLFVSAACHNKASIQKANALAADISLISPIFPTESHIDVTGIGVLEFNTLKQLSTQPVAALGGITIDNAADLKPLNLAAIAGISGLLSHA